MYMYRDENDAAAALDHYSHIFQSSKSVVQMALIHLEMESSKLQAQIGRILLSFCRPVNISFPEVDGCYGVMAPTDTHRIHSTIIEDNHFPLEESIAVFKCHPSNAYTEPCTEASLVCTFPQVIRVTRKTVLSCTFHRFGELMGQKGVIQRSKDKLHLELHVRPATVCVSQPSEPETLEDPFVKFEQIVATIEAMTVVDKIAVTELFQVLRVCHPFAH